jgi:hypothetical protein
MCIDRPGCCMDDLRGSASFHDESCCPGSSRHTILKAGTFAIKFCQNSRVTSHAQPFTAPSCAHKFLKLSISRSASEGHAKWMHAPPSATPACPTPQQVTLLCTLHRTYYLRDPCTLLDASPLPLRAQACRRRGVGANRIRPAPCTMRRYTVITKCPSCPFTDQGRKVLQVPCFRRPTRLLLIAASSRDAMGHRRRKCLVDA